MIWFDFLEVNPPNSMKSQHVYKQICSKRTVGILAMGNDKKKISCRNSGLKKTEAIEEIFVRYQNYRK